MSPLRNRLAWRVVYALAVVLVIALWARHASNSPPRTAAGVIAPAPLAEAEPLRQVSPEPAAKATESVASASATGPAPKLAAFRVSLAQRAADQQRIREDPDLAALVEELAERARGGDIDATRALLDLLRLCAAAAAMGPESDPQEWRRLALWGDLDARFLDAMAVPFAAEQGRCAPLLMANLEGFEAIYNEWMQLARERGDPLAVLNDWSTPGPSEQARWQAALEILREGDSQSLARYSMQLSLLSGLGPEAYVLAACQTIDACAVDPQAYALQHLSAQSYAGNDGAWLLLRMMTPRQRQISSGQAAMIVRAWRAGQFEQLLQPQTQPPKPPGAR